MSPSLRRRLALTAVAGAALSFGYGAGWPDVSRLGMTEALALDGTLRIDRYASQTQDRADFGGHAYTVYAPGNSFLALPGFAVLRAVGLVDADARARGVWHERGLLWALRALTGGLAFVALVLVVARAAEGLAPGTGLVTTCTVGLGTMALPLAATTYSHLSAGVLTFVAFLLARSRSNRVLAAAGACAGAAVAFEYTAALALVIVGAYAILRRRGVAGPLAFAAGAAPPLALLAIYNALAFGSPRHFSYRYVSAANFPGLHRGFFGIGSPSLHTLAQTLFGHRGLFVVSPVLLAALGGLASTWLRGRRAEAGTAIAVTLALTLLTASYFDPYGGLSPGPRYAAAALPFLALGLPDAFLRWPRATAALALISVGGSLYEAGTYGPNFDWATVWWWLGLPRLAGMAIVVALVASAVALAAPDVLSLRAKRRAAAGDES